MVGNSTNGPLLSQSQLILYMKGFLRYSAMNFLAYFIFIAHTPDFCKYGHNYGGAIRRDPIVTLFCF